MRPLFGGAIVCDFPITYEDVSYFREIPDNEEVYHETTTDSSLIVELLEFQNDQSDDDIAKFHFSNIAEENDARTATIQEMGFIERSNERFKRFIVCSGIQTGITKFREQDPIGNDIKIWIAVARLKELNVEIVLSVTAPTSISQTSSSHTHGSAPDVVRGQQVFETAVSSLSVVDYGVFA